VGILLAELSRTQDENVGDGTSSVVVLAGELLRGAGIQLDKGVHPGIIIRGLEKAQFFCVENIEALSIPLDVDHEDRIKTDRALGTSLETRVALRAVTETCLGSKVVRHAMAELSEVDSCTLAHFLAVARVS